jgi:hypothetical protein
MRISTVAIALLCNLFLQTAAYSDDEFCSKVGQLAGLVMEGRQQGVIMSTAMQSASGTTDMAELRRLLIIEAYKSPRYSTDRMKQSAIVDFRNEAELSCYTANN